jgi:cytochrome c biogenesis protein
MEKLKKNSLVSSLVKLFINLKFAIFLLLTIAIFSSVGSFIEQDETIEFYQKNYSSSKAIYGFIDANFILSLGLNNIYQTWWFLSFLFLLGLSLVSCSLVQQFPIVQNSKKEFFKKELLSFSFIPFFVKIKNVYYIKEILLGKIQKLNFYIYQKKNFFYAYKGLIGRISPILVHASLITILLGASLGAFKNLKAQEMLPKGEVFRIQNLVKVGPFSSVPTISVRINDFWIEYQKKKIRQFYSNLSILQSDGSELKNQTISVNNPVKYQSFDFYQSDWNLVGIRGKNSQETTSIEYPLFTLKENTKSWITWIKKSDTFSLKKTFQETKNFENFSENYTLVFDQLENTFFIYNKKGEFLKQSFLNQTLFDTFSIIEILPSSGLLIKSDPSIPIIYLGFTGLMITTILSYLPYTQLWVFTKSTYFYVGGKTNRGKIQVEITFENIIRYIIFNSTKIMKTLGN